jgi:hypothetical protein
MTGGDAVTDPDADDSGVRHVAPRWGAATAIYRYDRRAGNEHDGSNNNDGCDRFFGSIRPTVALGTGLTGTAATGTTGSTVARGFAEAARAPAVQSVPCFLSIELLEPLFQKSVTLSPH